ncbi:hypothetical protein Bca52824_057938 [Brassica carinata]|uniref:Uncharacterized protein n=1 Tax=Brassica carinata TaxID=52824 RepID=A0A8X7QTC8_BRACI|nr:hypothetical protein Bca52824_057938 [Brassica carinata]
MVATLILVRDENGDLHDPEGHMLNAAGQRLDDQRAVIPDHDDDATAAAQRKWIMAGNRGGKKKTTKKSGKSTTSHVAEEHVEELSDGNNSDDMCDPPSEGMKGLKRKRPSTGCGVSSRTRARKAVSNGNEPVREESNPVRGTTVVSLSLDTEIY